MIVLIEGMPLQYLLFLPFAIVWFHNIWKTFSSFPLSIMSSDAGEAYFDIDLIGYNKAKDFTSKLHNLWHFHPTIHWDVLLLQLWKGLYFLQLPMVLFKISIKEEIVDENREYLQCKFITSLAAFHRKR